MQSVKSPVESTLEEIHAVFKANTSGRVADYIPELAKADPSHFGIVLVTVDGRVYEVGDTSQVASNRKRTRRGAENLRDKAQQIVVYELQGELVFSTTEVVVRDLVSAADSLFFLTAGSVSVQLPLQNGNHKRIVSFDAGSVFGEVAFVDGSTRSAMVFADTPARCFEMERDDFDLLGETHPTLKIKLLQNLLIVFSSNLRKANREIATLGQ